MKITILILALFMISCTNSNSGEKPSVLNAEKKKSVFIDKKNVPKKSKFNSTQNILSIEDYKSISFNGKTIKEIESARGDTEEDIKKMFGSYLKINKSPSGDMIVFYYKDFIIEMNLYDGNRLTSFEIKTDKIVVSIKDVFFKKGDLITKFKDVKSNVKSNGDLSLLFSPVENSSEYLKIDYKIDTGVITGIKYLNFF